MPILDVIALGEGRALQVLLPPPRFIQDGREAPIRAKASSWLAKVAKLECHPHAACGVTFRRFRSRQQVISRNFLSSVSSNPLAGGLTITMTISRSAMASHRPVLMGYRIIELTCVFASIIVATVVQPKLGVAMVKLLPSLDSTHS
jgi:hypothetical protein